MSESQKHSRRGRREAEYDVYYQSDPEVGTYRFSDPEFGDDWGRNNALARKARAGTSDREYHESDDEPYYDDDGPDLPGSSHCSGGKRSSRHGSQQGSISNFDRASQAGPSAEESQAGYYDPAWQEDEYGYGDYDQG
jgi:hypothetical protein